MPVEDSYFKRPACRTRRHQSGQASIKLAIGMAVASAAVKLIQPRLSEISTLEVVDHTLESQLQTVRLRAVAEDRCIKIYFNAANETFQIASKRTVTPCGETGYANEGPARPIDKDGQVKVAATANPVFDTYGNAPTEATITLTGPNGNSRTVIVNGEGRVNGR